MGIQTHISLQRFYYTYCIVHGQKVMYLADSKSMLGKLLFKSNLLQLHVEKSNLLRVTSIVTCIKLLPNTTQNTLKLSQDC